MKTKLNIIASGSLFALLIQPMLAQTGEKPKPPTEATKAWNKKIQEALPFSNKEDFELASRGLIARPDNLQIKDAKGNVIWDMAAYSFIKADKPAPDSVNPSLWRNAQLNMQYGLYKVIDGIYQVRGFDLSNITFIQGEKGWIVFDPLISAETAKAAYELVTKELGARPVLGVVYSHSHIDHYGGVRGLVDEADVKSGKVQILAPEGFTEHAISENVIAGNAMGRRAIYMYGAVLPKSAEGQISGGLGQTTSTGAAGLILPTKIIDKTGEEVTIDGVKMVFQLTPGTEAPAEMNTYFPKMKALWMAENTTDTLHNLYTLRGAQVRDALKWAYCIGETIDLFGKDTEVVFQSHHWPRWENAKIIPYMKKQRDVYKYIHDQSVRLLNKGLNGEEIAEELAGHLPPELAQEWYNRGYYGTVAHNAKAVYQRYMGWYDANPANLDPLPPVPAAKKYVEFMGGSAEAIKKAKASFNHGEYRWVAQVMKHVVFAEPENKEGRALLADALEQLGYQAESGPWRCVYLMGAFELRNGVPNAGGTKTSSPDTIKAMPPEMLFDYLAVRLNGPKAVGKNLSLNLTFTDLNESYLITVENGTMNYAKGKTDPNANVSLTMTKADLNAVQLKEATMEDKIASGAIKLEGNKATLGQFLGLLDTFPYWFNIVTP